jgi:hypothetical protein
MTICECTNCGYPEAVLDAKWLCKECFTEHDTKQTEVNMDTACSCDFCNDETPEEELFEHITPESDFFLCYDCKDQEDRK